MDYFTRFVTILFISFVLVQCTTFESTAPACPKTTVISELSRAPLHPILDHDPRVAILSLDKVSCGPTIVESGLSRTATMIGLTVTIPEARKKTNHTKKAKFPIFVAIVDAEENVLDRYDGTLDITISDNPLAYKHTITYLVPEGLSIEGKDYQLFVGFNGSVTSASGSKVSHSLQKAVRKKAHNKRVKR